MDHVGLDLSGTLTQVVVLSSTGEVKERERVPTRDLPAWLRERPPSRVVMEACTQSPAIARESLAAKHETVVVPGQVVRALGVGARGIKTDERDAEVLATASVRSATLPSVHLRTASSRSLLQLIAARVLLLKSRTHASLHVKSWLRGRLIGVRGRASSAHFAVAVRKLAETHPEGLPLAVEILLQAFETLTAKIEELDAQLEAAAATNATCQLLMTMPGIGPIGATMFVAHIDDITRFESAEALTSYLGLVPGEATTSFKIQRTRTIKAGPKYLRAQLVQSAWSMWNKRPNDPLVVWARGIAEKRGKRSIAIIALARKMSRALYAMWKTTTPYDPSRPTIARAAPRT
jgi:transposase